jgi:hypothetical protein
VVVAHRTARAVHASLVPLHHSVTSREASKVGSGSVASSYVRYTLLAPLCSHAHVR